MWITLVSFKIHLNYTFFFSLMLKYILSSSLIQNIFEKITLFSLMRNLNYILHSYVKIHTLIPFKTF